jgi:hypothetical protein
MKHPGCEHTVSLPSYLGMISSSLTNAASVCAGVDQPTGPIDTTMYDYETMESVDDDLIHNLCELVRTPVFKYFQVRIQCSYLVRMPG